MGVIEKRLQTKALNAFIQYIQDLPACEALFEHMALIHCLSKNQCFVLINARCFFSANELLQLYKMAQYQKMNLMLLESHAFEPLKEIEEVILFDED